MSRDTAFSPVALDMIHRSKQRVLSAAYSLSRRRVPNEPIPREDLHHFQRWLETELFASCDEWTHLLRLQACSDEFIADLCSDWMHRHAQDFQTLWRQAENERWHHFRFRDELRAIYNRYERDAKKRLFLCPEGDEHA